MDERALRNFIDSLVPSAAPCAAAAVVSRDGPLFEYRVGNRQIEPTIKPLLPDTMFDLASLTKVVGVTTVLLKTLEEGLLTLDARVGDFYPDALSAKATIENLATHSAGFVPEERLWRHVEKAGDALPFILREKLAYEPGTRVLYSCFGFIVLGSILSLVHGKPLDVLVRDYVTRPLGMRDTLYRPLSRKGATYAATEVDERDGLYHNGVVHDENANFLGGVSGNAGLFSTLRDMEIFAMAMLDGSFLSPSSLSLITTPLTLSLPGETRSLGWRMRAPELFGRCEGKRVIGHTGFTGTSLVLDMEGGRGCVLLTNRVHPSRENRSLLPLRRLFSDLAFA